MSSGDPTLARCFREAAAAIDPATGSPPLVSPDRIEAWVAVHAIRGQTRWIDAVVEAAQPRCAREDASPAHWLRAWCRAWVSRAAPAFRRHADRLAPDVPSETASVAPLLDYWRITGGPRWLDTALTALSAGAAPGDTEAAEAFRQAWRATADPDYLAQARSGYGLPLAELPPAAWAGAVEVLGRDAIDSDELAERLEDEAPETVLLAAAALGLPRLHVTIQWWIERELREGPVAEAITYPWPALEVAFERMDERDQVRFVIQVGDKEFEPIVDAGVVGAGITEYLHEADRSLFLEAASARRRSVRRR